MRAQLRQDLPAQGARQLEHELGSTVGGCERLVHVRRILKVRRFDDVRSANVYGSGFEYDESEPPGYRSGEAEIGSVLGGKELTVRLYDIPAGSSLCPYHYEYVEEWLLVVDGAISVRTPAGETRLERGDLVRFEAGPEGAHKVASGGEDGSARVLMFSSARVPAVAVYPDSDKIGVWPGREEDNVMVRRAEAGVDYWEGEG
jgi:uncharacterized cupin superfamily protein